MKYLFYNICKFSNFTLEVYDFFNFVIFINLVIYLYYYSSIEKLNHESITRKEINMLYNLLRNQ